MKVLVIGGSGLIGRPVVAALLEAGFDVAVAGRSAGKIREIFRSGVTPVEIDITNRQSLAGKFSSFDALHLSLPSGPRFSDSFRNEAGGACNIVEEAVCAGINRISYLSGATDLSDDHSFPPARVKFMAESAIKNSGIPYTIWRASWFMDTLPKLAVGGIVGVLGKGTVSPHWIAGSDFGKMVGAALLSDAAANKTLYAFGAHKVAFKDAARIFRDICYPGYPLVHLPIPVVELFARISFRHEMKFGAQMIKFLEHDGEFGDPSEANRLVGQAVTTVEQFCRSRLKDTH